MKKIKNPLRRRIPRELAGDWRKYLVVSLFLILMIGFVSGMYVANESMLQSSDEGKQVYKLEDGHFELKTQADDRLLDEIANGEKADVKTFYTNKAKDELDEKFDDEFEDKFKKEFDGDFAKEFDSSFEQEIKKSLMAKGLDKNSVESVLPETIEKAKKSKDYKTSYESAYKEAYKTAYDEAHKKAYDEAWEKVRKEIDKEYSKAEEKYELNDKNFKAVSVNVYENFYRNEDEDDDGNGKLDGSIRVFAKTDDINKACLLKGDFPKEADEIAIDRMHADNAGIKVGDTITVGSKELKVVGLIAYVNYSCLFEKNTDFMFDALKFNVGMVTEEGFESLESPVHYNYAWKYKIKPSDEKDEKKLSDNFMKSLLTQAITDENELKDFLPAYGNQAINFAPDDMNGDKSMGGILLDILTVIIAFIFAVTISNTIAKESKTIGTLRASGYTKGELIRHYLSMPVIVTLISAIVGNILGYTVFKNTVVSMYYNSYSLPTYETVLSPSAFIKTTFIPLVLMFAVNLFVIVKQLSHTPLQFLHHDLKKSKRGKAMRLPRWKFFGRFRLRIVLQNIPNYMVLTFGIFFVSFMMLFAIGLPETLDIYKENATDNMFAEYQYMLNSYEDEDGKIIKTSDKNAEPFAMRSLLKKSEKLDEDVSVYGIEPDSKYVKIFGLKNLDKGKVYISESFAKKYKLSEGDKFTLEEQYENEKYEFEVAGTYDKSLNVSVFMPIEKFRSVFNLKEDEFSGFMSNKKLTDIPKSNTATVITKRDITKMCDQLDHSMGSMMNYLEILCVLLAAVLIYLLTKIIIEKNESSISMTKILGYENGEISRLYLLSTSIVFVIADALCVFLGTLFMVEFWKAFMSTYNGWFEFSMSPFGYAKVFLSMLIGYFVILGFDFRRIKKIPLNVALKNAD